MAIFRATQQTGVVRVPALITEWQLQLDVQPRISLACPCPIQTGQGQLQLRSLRSEKADRVFLYANHVRAIDRAIGRNNGKSGAWLSGRIIRPVVLADLGLCRPRRHRATLVGHRHYKVRCRLIPGCAKVLLASVIAAAEVSAPSVERIPPVPAGSSREPVCKAESKIIEIIEASKSAEIRRNGNEESQRRDRWR
jgi:hypothetical protein